MKNRSLLFVPSKEKLLKKIEILNADVYILDLEDSIEQENKQDALENVVNFLKNFNTIQKKIFIRLNKENYLKELTVLESFSNIGFMLPKFERTKDYISGEQFFALHDIIALIESPMGIVNIEEIVACPWIDAVAFGAEDYTSCVNMKNTPESLVYQKSRIVTYAKAYGKKVYDTPSFQLEDYEAFCKEVEHTIDLGFDGKMVISPKHIDYINVNFSKYDLEHIRRIVDIFETAGKAVLVIDDVVYEKMHINQMKKILKEQGEG